MFDEHRTLWKLPTVGRREDYLFGGGIVRTVVGDGQPALFNRAIGPEWGIYGVGNERVGRRESGEICEYAELRKQGGRFWNGSGDAFDFVNQACTDTADF